jgi:hypothetical protein
MSRGIRLCSGGRRIERWVSSPAWGGTSFVPAVAVVVRKWVREIANEREGRGLWEEIVTRRGNFLETTIDPQFA